MLFWTATPQARLAVTAGEAAMGEMVQQGRRAEHMTVGSTMIADRFQSGVPPRCGGAIGAACRPAPPISSRQMADRLVSLAEEADRAGFNVVAAGLITLVYAVLDTAAGAPGRFVTTA